MSYHHVAHRGQILSREIYRATSYEVARACIIYIRSERRREKACRANGRAWIKNANWYSQPFYASATLDQQREQHEPELGAASLLHRPHLSPLRIIKWADGRARVLISRRARRDDFPSAPSAITGDRSSMRRESPRVHSSTPRRVHRSVPSRRGSARRRGNSVCGETPRRARPRRPPCREENVSSSFTYFPFGVSGSSVLGIDIGVYASATCSNINEIYLSEILLMGDRESFISARYRVVIKATRVSNRLTQ